MLKKIYDRICRLILTIISKQWLVFFIGTVLLTRSLITAEVWVFLASVVIGANVFQKHLFRGEENAGEKESNGSSKSLRSLD